MAGHIPVEDLNAPAPPWDYNPSAWSQRVPVAALAFVAFLLAAWMGAYQWKLVGSVWDPIFGEQTLNVLDSGPSERMKTWFGIPDGVLGAIAYLGDVIFAMAGSTRRWQFRPWLVIVFGIDVIPLGGVSAILVLIQAFVLGKYCFLCIVTAVISLILIYFAYDEVWSSLVYLRRVWRRTHDPVILWLVFWGLPVRQSPDAVAVES